MASSGDINAASIKECVDNIQSILNDRCPSDTEINRLVQGIKVEIQNRDDEISLASLKDPFRELLTYLKSDTVAQKQRLKSPSSSSSNNHLDDTQKKQVREHLRRVADKARRLKANVADFLELIGGGDLEKKMLTYCSLYPKDYMLDAERLIHLCMAEGFPLPSSSSASETEAKKYLKDMVERSICEEVNERIHEEVRSFIKMKPAMHQIAQRMVDVHVQRASYGLRSEDMFKIPTHVLDKAKELKSLVLFRENKMYLLNLPKEVLKDVFKSFKMLSVLDLRKLQITEVPKSIEDLKALKYLDLSENKMKNLPKTITKLCKLETLKLFYCDLLEELPNDLNKLTQLEHLDLEGCSSLTGMPTKMSKMSSLQTLSAFVASEGRRCLEDLDKLNELGEHLEILHLERLKVAPEGKYLEKKKQLQFLKLHWDPQAKAKSMGEIPYKNTLDQLHPNSALKVLFVKYYPGSILSSWVTNSNHIRKLRLEDCSNCLYLSEEGRFSNFKILELASLDNLKYITKYRNADLCESLEELSINRCPNLKSWRKTEQVVNDWGTFNQFKSLVKLRLENCRGRKYLFDQSQLPKLKILELIKLDSLEYITQNSNADLCESLEELTINGCPKLKSWWKTEVINDWGTFNQFKSLVKLRLENCSGREYLFEQDQLPKLKILELINLNNLKYITDNKLAAFDESLEELTIKNCPNLKSWWKTEQGRPLFTQISKLDIPEVMSASSS